MTNEQRVAKLKELDTQVNEYVKQYNEAMGENKFDEAAKLDKLIEETVNEYTSVARTLCFEHCCAAGEPVAIMRRAVETLSYLTIAVKDEENEDGTETRIVISKTRAIDLKKLHAYAPNGIGADKRWNDTLEKMNYHLTARQAKRIMGKDNLTKFLKDLDDCYEMSAVAKAIDMGKDPTSNTKILATLQSVVTAMIGEEYKATSHDVNYLLDVYAKKSSKKALTITAATHRYLRNYMMDVCHRIVTGGSYGVECKEIKTK